MRHAIVVTGLVLLCSVPYSARSVPTEQNAPPLAPSVQAANDKFVRDILSGIAGREAEPASQVFRNVQIFKTISARQLLTIMSVGYAPALGVACTHCHVETDFASEDKRPKRAAREMAVMHRAINDQLAKMQNLDTPATADRSINCTTCHRGRVNPRLGG